jgi:hypothetical protein
MGRVEKNVSVHTRKRKKATKLMMRMAVWNVPYEQHLGQIQALESAKCSARENLCWWFVQQWDERLFQLPVFL